MPLFFCCLSELYMFCLVILKTWRQSGSCVLLLHYIAIRITIVLPLYYHPCGKCITSYKPAMILPYTPL